MYFRIESEIMIISILYGVAVVVSLLAIFGYCKLIKNKDIWFVLLFVSVLVVNCGYLTLSLSSTLGEAMLANRFAYLGSVFLPLCMLMIIMNVCKVGYPKWLTYVLFGISAIVFVIAASQGYTDWYYADVNITFIDGAAKLVKEYGPLHNLYYIYLLVYLLIMAGIIVFAFLKKHVFNWKLAALLLCATFGNIMIWLVEQLIRGDFEFLSISYIVTELFLLFLYGLLQDHDIINDLGINQRVFDLMQDDDHINLDKLIEMNPILKELTARELEVLIPILQDKKRKEIAEELSVTEHTIKKHTAHIFSKLEVSSRRELHEKLNIK